MSTSFLGLLRVASAAFFVACATAPTLAQWGTPDHSIPIGRGAGKTGFKSVGPCAVDAPIVGTGVNADPACGTVNVEQTFSTRAAAQAATINSVATVITLNGYTTVGDAPAQRYTRISAPSPAKGYHFQSADGQWWQLADTAIAPESVGAKGDWDGTPHTDDTQAWRDVASYITLRNGGVKVTAMPGKSYLVFPQSGGTPGNVALIQLTGLKGFGLDLKGSRLVTNNTFTAQASQIYGILLTTCSEFAVDNFSLNHTAIGGTLDPSFGLIGIYSNGSSNGTITNTRQVGGVGAIALNGTQPYGDASVRSTGLKVSGVYADTAYYSVQSEFANAIDVSGIRTINAGRSLFIENNNNSRFQLWSNNGGPFDDVIVSVLAVNGATAATNSTSGITLDYYNPTRSVAPAGGNSLVRLNFVQASASSAAGTIKDIYLNMHVDGDGKAVSGLRFVKVDTSGTIPDATVRGHTIDNVVVRGKFANWAGQKVGDLFSATDWGTAGGDFVRNIIFEDFEWEGAGSSLDVNATYVDRNLVFENVLGTTNLNVTGAAAGVLRTTNVRVPNISEVTTLCGFTAGCGTLAFPASVASYTLTFPAAAGTAGQPLLYGTPATFGTLGTGAGGTGLTSIGAGMATWWGTPSSANLAATVTDETGTGPLVFGTNPALTAPTIAGGTHTGITSFGLRSSGTGAFDLTARNSENLTAGRILTVTVNDGSRTFNLGGDFTTIGGNIILRTPSATDVTFPTTGTVGTLAGSETLTNKTLTAPILTTPTLGVATATSINKVAVTAPASSATLTVADGTTLTTTSSTSIGRGQYQGSNTNATATAGNLGEILNSEVLAGAPVNVSNNTATNCTSKDLTAGRWVVHGNVQSLPAGTTTQSRQIAWISTTSATLPTIPNKGAYQDFAINMSAGNGMATLAGTRILELNATTTVYLSAYMTFGVSTMQMYCYLEAIRM
jgi:hypothetical protein